MTLGDAEGGELALGEGKIRQHVCVRLVIGSRVQGLWLGVIVGGLWLRNIGQNWSLGMKSSHVHPSACVCPPGHVHQGLSFRD